MIKIILMTFVCTVYFLSLAKGRKPAQVSASSLVEELKKNKEPQFEIIKTVSKPTQTSCHEVQYRLPEFMLKPNQMVYFDLPPTISQSAVTFVILGHRQDPKTQQGSSDPLKKDQYPGLTSIQFYSATDQDWKFWAGSASGEWGAKFAEIRDRAELENLYDWGYLGYRGLKNSHKQFSPLKSEVARIISTGLDPILLSEFSIKTLADFGASQDVLIFSPGTSFGDPYTMKKYSYGGGQDIKYKGTFPGALELSEAPKDTNKEPLKSILKKLPSGWTFEKNNLVFTAKSKIEIHEIEVAVGDTFPDQIKNKDGGWGSLGFAKLNIIGMGLDSKSKPVEETWMYQNNVPPQGVLRAAPFKCNHILKPGEKIRINANGSPAYVMGVRLRYTLR